VEVWVRSGLIRPRIPSERVGGEAPPPFRLRFREVRGSFGPNNLGFVPQRTSVQHTSTRCQQVSHRAHMGSEIHGEASNKRRSQLPQPLDLYFLVF
jgi:hypothetical protein